MKKIFQYIFGMAFLLIGAIAMTGCTPDNVDDIDPTKVPNASDIDVNINVDQETNQVTFTLNNKECNPIWQFADGKKSTVNGYSQIFAIAGEYKVEIKTYNRNGISDGSVVKTFKINNTIFDFAPYLKRLCGSDGNGKIWQIAAGTPGHLSCGSPGSDGTDWWKAPANDKAGTGLYDNLFTFTKTDAVDGGSYTFDPGTAGTVYVNNGCSIFAEYNNKTNESGAKIDFSAPAEKQTVNFSFQVAGNDLYIVFPAKTMLGYIPNDNTYNTPKFKVQSIKDNSLELVTDDGTIAWHYIFEPKAKEITKEELLSTAAGKTWVWDSNNGGHLSCGPSGSDGNGWWSAGAGEKTAFGLYTQSFTFSSDGKYVFNPGEKGLYVNNGCTYFPEYNNSLDGNGNKQDFNYPMAAQTSTWKFEDVGTSTYLVLPEGTFLGYLANDDMYKTPRFRVLSITADKIELVNDNGSIAWHYTLVTDAGSTPPPPAGFQEGSELMPSEYKDGLVGQWTWEASTDGHFGCGQTLDNATGWYSATANAKDGMGLYDDLLTFNADGSYIFNPGEGGTVYCNAGLTEFFQDAKNGATVDFQAPVSEQKASYVLSQEADGYYITFPAQTIVSYIPTDEFYKAPKVKIVKMTTNTIEFNTVNLKNGDTTISWHYRLKRVK